MPTIIVAITAQEMYDLTQKKPADMPLETYMAHVKDKMKRAIL